MVPYVVGLLVSFIFLVFAELGFAELSFDHVVNFDGSLCCGFASKLYFFSLC
jgi:hypothetical protein